MRSQHFPFLYIDDHFVSQHLSFEEAIVLVEQAFLSFYQAKDIMPAKQYLNLDQFRGDFRAMPAFSKEQQIAGLKWINVHPNNTMLPTVMGIVLLNDPKTGKLLSIIEATELTKIRTAAVTVIAQTFLAYADVKTIALIGLGEQAKAQVRALATKLTDFKVSFWDLSAEKRNAFSEWLDVEGVAKVNATSLESCVGDADLIVSLTPSRVAWLKKAMLKKHVLICALGADGPGKQELEFDILKAATIVVDDWEQASHSGEIHQALQAGIIHKQDVSAELGEIIAGKILKKKDITVFDSTGLALHDLVCAAACYQKFTDSK